MKRSRLLHMILMVLLLAITLGAPDRSAGDVPARMSYQGLLLDLGGIPMEGNFNMTFSIYADSTGGAALWTENHNNSTRPVTVTDGLFEVTLGEFVPITPDVFDGTVRWLQTTVAGEDLRPRKPINSVAYAFKAAEVPPSGGLTKIAFSSFSSATSVHVTGLSPDTRYLLMIRVKHGGDPGIYYLRVGGDTGSNYQYCVMWTSDNSSRNAIGSGGSGATRTYGVLTPTGSTGGGIRANEHWNGNLHISTNYNDPSWTLVQQWTVWDCSQYSYGATCTEASGFVRHHGGSDLSSITIYTDAGNMTGEYALYEYE